MVIIYFSQLHCVISTLFSFLIDSENVFIHMGKSHLIFMLMRKRLSRLDLLPRINRLVAEQYQEL